MQHNSWKKDRELLSEAYGQINEAIPAILGALGRAAASGAARGAGTAAGTAAVNALTSSGSDSGSVEDQEEGNILERLEEFMNSHPETVEGLRQIIIDFEDIIDDINRLEAEDGTIDATDLGIHLARLAPDTTKGSVL